eukprot:jgi/Galph1/1468/GphlegSOOS_G149.1
MELLQTRYRYLIILDLEATALDVSNLLEQEIVEWPWAVYDTVETKVLETQTVLIKSTDNENNYHSLDAQKLAKNAIVAQNLREAVLYFDNFIFEKFTSCGKSFCLLTDGPWDLRHLLLVEASRKRIKLAHHYRTYFDLRVEFRRCFPQGPLPKDRQTMASYLDVPFNSVNNGQEDCYSIAAIITQMLLRGYLFSLPEVIPSEEWFKGGLPCAGGGVHLAVPIPAIPAPYDPQSSLLQTAIEACPIAAGVPTGAIIRLRGLPWSVTREDVLKFLQGVDIIPLGIHFVFNTQGKPTGEAFVQLTSHRYIEVFKSTPQEMSTVLGRSDTRHPIPSTNNHLSYPSSAVYSNASLTDSDKSSFIVRMRGLPFSATADQVARFFDGIEIAGTRNGGGIYIVQNQEGRSLGEAFVQFTSEDGLRKALERHKQSMGKRYIELFKSSLMEMLNTIERHGGPVARAAVETTICGHISATGIASVPSQASTCSVIRIRGIPYDATAADIEAFFSDYHIVPGGIHFVMDSLDRPKGEALVKFFTVEERNDALEKRNREYMKGRYLELFEASDAEISALVGNHLSNSIATAAASIAKTSLHEMTDTMGPSMTTSSLKGLEGFPHRYYKYSIIPNRTVRMRGLPFRATISDIQYFFSEFPLAESDIELGVDKLGRPSGEAWVTFHSEEEAKSAVTQLQHAHMGKRYIELFLCTRDKGISTDSKTLEGNDFV